MPSATLTPTLVLPAVAVVIGSVPGPPTWIRPLLVMVSRSSPPSMPTAVAVALADEFPDPRFSTSPTPKVTATLVLVAVAAEAALLAIELALSIVSTPAPPWRPAA